MLACANVRAKNFSEVQYLNGIFTQLNFYAAEKMKFSIKDFVSQCDLLKKVLHGKFHFLSTVLLVGQNECICENDETFQAARKEINSEKILECPVELSKSLF